MIPHASHLPTLVKACLNTRGPILELGAGYYSTPILHEFAIAQNRPLLTVDHDPDWLARFDHLRGPRHRFQLVRDWNEFQPDPKGYGLALIDHAPAERRAVDIAHLAHLVTLFVIHDSESPEYRYGTIWDLVERRETDTTFGPWTTTATGRRDP